MPKDRRRRRVLAIDVHLLTERSSVHPVGYAITPLAFRDGAWRTVCLFDNAHAREEHHEHRFVGLEKQAPVVTHGPVNEAMYAAEIKVLNGWPAMLAEWENVR